MTRKHFNELARILKENRPSTKHRAHYEGWEKIREGIVELCKESNPNFQTIRFYEETEK